MRTSNERDVEQVLHRLEGQFESNAGAISRIGARMVVLCKFVEAVLPQLNAVQSGEIRRRFRQGVEEAMSLTDDVALPGAYQTTLLEQTNVLLIALERRGAA
jgi:hypothetical protein